MNEVRAANGLRPLRIDTRAERAARAHSRDMIRRKYFAHGKFAKRLRGYRVRGRALGENLAWGVGKAASPTAIVQAWLASPYHRANLLRPGFRRVGLGQVRGPFAGHSSASVITVDFAGS